MNIKWKQPKHHMTFEVPPDLYHWLRSERERLNVSMNAIFQSICYRAKKRGVQSIELPKTPEEKLKYSLEGMTPDERKQSRKSNHAEVHRKSPGLRRRSKETF